MTSTPIKTWRKAFHKYNPASYTKTAALLEGALEGKRAYLKAAFDFNAAPLGLDFWEKVHCEMWNDMTLIEGMWHSKKLKNKVAIRALKRALSIAKKLEAKS